MQNVTGALLAPAPFQGSITSIIKNREALYEGNLNHYFRVIFYKAQNLNHPYHNFRHMLHVVYLCYCACDFYRNELTGRQMRNLLIAALFHDFNHSGKMGNDRLNIEKAVAGLHENILPIDVAYFDNIVMLIDGTEYPHKTPSSELSLLTQILRDADMSQAFSVAWIQQVIFGLAEEWGKTPLEVLRIQAPFLKGVTLVTEWAKQTFTAKDFENKIEEAQEMLELLEEAVV